MALKSLDSKGWWYQHWARDTLCPEHHITQPRLFAPLWKTLRHTSSQVFLLFFARSPHTHLARPLLWPTPTLHSSKQPEPNPFPLDAEVVSFFYSSLLLLWLPPFYSFLFLKEIWRCGVTGVTEGGQKTEIGRITHFPTTIWGNKDREAGRLLS